MNAATSVAAATIIVVHLRPWPIGAIQVTLIIIIIIITTTEPESPARGLRSSPPACTVSLTVGSSKARDLDLDLGSGQGHVNIHSTCRTTCMLNHVTVAARTTEIWSFEFRQISILDEV